MSEQYKDWTDCEGVPNVDGAYLVRMDHLDDEEDFSEAEVIDGKAYKNGKHWIFCNHQWKKADT